MFGARYYGTRYYGGRFFGHSGDASTATEYLGSRYFGPRYFGAYFGRDRALGSGVIVYIRQTIPAFTQALESSYVISEATVTQTLAVMTTALATEQGGAGERRVYLTYAVLEAPDAPPASYTADITQSLVAMTQAGTAGLSITGVITQTAFPMTQAVAGTQTVVWNGAGEQSLPHMRQALRGKNPGASGAGTGYSYTSFRFRF